jgi:RNA polymerase sigma factor (sigma-70 family)
MDVDEHLFRREAGRLVSALTRIFGVHNLALAEDVVQDAFCRALEVWRVRGPPDNPSAWLMTTARNRALDILRRQRSANTFAPELGRLLESEWTLAPVVDEILAADAIHDSMLRMMFSCCHPRLSEAAQVALILNILCGFGVDEIASAFTSRSAAIEKRIVRGKKFWRNQSICSIRPCPPTSLTVFMRSSERSICHSTRAITERRPKLRFVRNFAVRRCASPPHWFSIRLGKRRPRTR